MAIQVKAIYPPKMRPDLYKQAMIAELGRQSDQVLRLYLATTRTWKHKPKFRVDFKYGNEPVREGGGAAFAVMTDDEIFHYVDQGTKGPYPIPRVARPGKRLAFRTKYRAKTRRRVLGSGAGGSSGDLVRPTQVMHPGIKARQFTQEIQKRRRAPFFRAMKEAHLKGLRLAKRG